MVELVLPLVFVLMIPFAVIGLALISTGLSRSRNAAHSLVSSVSAVAVAVLAFVAVGSAIAGGGVGQTFSRSFHVSDPEGLLRLIYLLFAVSLASLIPVASGAERWRWTATCFSTVLLAGLGVPFVAYWIWFGGFLHQFGVVDVGGAGVIQLTGGLTALVVAWLLGARQGKFTADGVPTAMPGHNAVIVLVGSLMALAGWIGLNGAGALLFYSAGAGAVLMGVVNTVVAAAGGAMAALLTTRIRFGKPDASLTANGWVCGMVAVSAGAPFVKIPEALLIGLVAGVVVVFAIEVVELRMRVDDPAGAIGVHAVGGAWGLLATGMFVDSAQVLTQLLGVGTLFGLVLPVVWAGNNLMNRFVRQRVDAMGERQGMDLYELGAGAYPEFVTHREDLRR